MSERRTATEARALLRLLLEGGTITWLGHAKREMAKDNVTAPDAVNVLRGGVVEEPEYENGAWRYRVRTQRIVVVCEFEEEDDEAPTGIVVVTVWREQRNQ